jgi:hypothetical protein
LIEARLVVCGREEVGDLSGSGDQTIEIFGRVAGSGKQVEVDRDFGDEIG